MSDTPLRIAITGASGYIGGRLIRQLWESGSVSYILATDISPPSIRLSGEAKFECWDVTESRPGIFSSHRIDTVIHLAYILNPARRKEHSRGVNVNGTDNVLRASREAGVKHVVYLSSTSVYGAHADNPTLLTETDPARPVEGFRYSQDKVAAESRLLEFAARNPEVAVTILRACPVMGPNANNFIANAFKKPILPAIGSADPPMQFLHEDDLVLTLARCLKLRPRGVYNVAGDGTIRWSEMVSVMERPLISLPALIWYFLTSAAWRLRIQDDSPACGLDFIRYRWTASAEKLKAELGIEFRHTSRSAWQSHARRNRTNPQ
jgi:UDP-glucose 4-epimerase